jgi:hypothetical protein
MLEDWHLTHRLMSPSCEANLLLERREAVLRLPKVLSGTNGHKLGGTSV